MTDINPELIEKAAAAMTDDWNPERYPVFSDMLRNYAQTALEAVADDLEQQFETTTRAKVEGEIRREAAKRAHPAGGASPKQFVDGIRLAAHLARGTEPERDPMWVNDCTICQGGGCLDCTDRSD